MRSIMRPNLVITSNGNRPTSSHNIWNKRQWEESSGQIIGENNNKYPLFSVNSDVNLVNNDIVKWILTIMDETESKQKFIQSIYLFKVI